MEGAGTQYHRELYLPKAPTYIFHETAYQNECRTTILEANKPACPMLKEDEITTDGHRVRATRCKRCQISRLAHRAMHEGLESATELEYI